MRYRGTLSRHAAILALAVLLSLGHSGPLSAQHMDPQKEIELGRQWARLLERYYGLSTDTEAMARVQRIGQTLAEQLAPRAYPYEFKVLNSPVINAFALPGGFIYIHDGLLRLLPNDDAIAFILAHEITHAAHRHMSKSADWVIVVKILSVVASVLAKDDRGLIASLVSQLADLKYSRQQEHDADAGGLELMWKAGYDLDGALAASRMIMEMERQESAPKYLRSHPPGDDRFRRAQEGVRLLKTRQRPSITTTPSSAPRPPDSALASATGDLSGMRGMETAWFPLAVGNTWIYSVDGAGGRSSYTVRIVGAIDTGQGTVYRSEVSFGKMPVSIQLFTTENGEVWQRMRPDRPGSPWRLDYVLESPAEGALAREGSEYTLVAIEDIDLPCGQFKGVRHILKRGDRSGGSVDLWFASGVGLIKRQSADTGVAESLIRYSLGTASQGAGP